MGKIFFCASSKYLSMDSSDSSEDFYAQRRKRAKIPQAKPCPFMDTVNRYLLDFDFEKVCSSTLASSNVYACLVCGKFFQGRGRGTPAFIHSMEQDHHVFLNLVDEKAYCLPDNYAIAEDSLKDIRFNLNPKFDAESLQTNFPNTALSLTGAEYVPGIVGLNLIREDSYLNASIQALAVVGPLRDFFLTFQPTPTCDKLTASFSRLLKRMFNPRSFKGVVSPQEFLQAVSTHSNKQFCAMANDPMAFLDWLLPIVDGCLGRDRGPVFQGKLNGAPFHSLHLQLPPVPVFRGQEADEFLSSVPLVDLLPKSFEPSQFLTLQISRFVKNEFFLEKNPTIVRFPIKGLDVGNDKFDLVAQICHEGDRPDSGKFIAYVVHPQTGQWFECNGLRIVKVLPQSVALVESYVQIWKRR